MASAWTLNDTTRVHRCNIYMFWRPARQLAAPALPEPGQPSRQLAARRPASRGKAKQPARSQQAANVFLSLAGAFSRSIPGTQWKDGSHRVTQQSVFSQDNFARITPNAYGLLIEPLVRNSADPMAHTWDVDPSSLHHPTKHHLSYPGLNFEADSWELRKERALAGMQNLRKAEQKQRYVGGACGGSGLYKRR